MHPKTQSRHTWRKRGSSKEEELCLHEERFYSLEQRHFRSTALACFQGFQTRLKCTHYSARSIDLSHVSHFMVNHVQLANSDAWRKLTALAVV
jgi:hypothetical protein